MEEVLKELENINTIKVKAKETKKKDSAKPGSNRRQEEHTKQQRRYNHHRSPIHQKNGISGAGVRAYHH
jgi:hypothetical protein